MNESIPRSCLVFIVVYYLIYFTTQAMRMAEQESLFLSVFSGLFLSANSKLEKSEYAVTANDLKNKSDIPILLFLACTGYQ